MEKGISRRDLFKLGGVAVAGAAAASMLPGCSPQKSSSSGSSSSSSSKTTTNSGHVRKGTPDFLNAPSAISDIKETKEYDVVIVGAGAAGVPAACAAKENGATVAVLQKENQATSHGNTGTGILLDSSDPAGVEAVVSILLQEAQYRGNRAQVELWAKNSGEAVKWVFDTATAAGAQTSDTTKKWTSAITTMNGYKVNYLSFDFGPKPYNTGDGIRALADYAAKQGIDFFYSTPAQQLVVESGKVTGVIAKGNSGYVKFKAKKGVILATGDYQNNEDMVDYYLPDLVNLGRKQTNQTGDGHLMGVWAGGAIENIGHTKMLHDFDAGPGSMCDMPFLAVKNDGTRFCDESVQMADMNNFLKTEADQGWYSQIFDANYMTTAAAFPGVLLPPAALAAYMPEDKGEKKGVYSDQVATYSADTIEGLAKKLGIDATEFAKTVKRYNELVAKGTDDDFGKLAKYLTPIDTPPFYGIHRHVRVSAIVSGLNVDKNLQVTKDGSTDPIPGLFACGNVAGNFFGGIDYTMKVPGLSLGKAYTQGRVVGKYVAKL